MVITLSYHLEKYSTKFSELTDSTLPQIHPGLRGRPRAGEELQAGLPQARPPADEPAQQRGGEKGKVTVLRQKVDLFATEIDVELQGRSEVLFVC